MRTSRRRHAQRGLTLIGLLGALAVLAILAAVLIPSAIRKLDLIAGAKETAMLESLAESFERSITRNGVIPAHANWAQAVATELGVNVAGVSENLRRQPRVLLIHPDFLVGDNDYDYGTEYVQDNLGSVVLNPANGRVIAPPSARMMIVSSIGVPLPEAIATWTPESEWTAADFNGIWNWNDAADAPPTGAAWAGWNGARDLKVQRVNLSPLFVRVVLTTYSSSADGLYSMDGVNLETAPSTLSGREGWYFQNTQLQLHNDQGDLEVTQVLTRNMSFVYQQDVWRSSLEGLGFAGGMDIGTIVDRFLRAPGNPESKAAKDGFDPSVQQQRVVQAFKEYMQAYTAWEAGGFGNNALLAAAEAKGTAMMTAVDQLYSNPNYYPPEVPCPE